MKTTLDGSLDQTIFNSGINGGIACKVCHTSASMKGKTVDQLNASNRDVPVMAQYASGAKALTQEQVAALAAYLIDPD